MNRIGNDTYIDGDIQIEGRYKSLRSSGVVLDFASQDFNPNVNVEFLGGFRAAQFAVKSYAENISGLWTFNGAPSITNWGTNPNNVATYGQLTALGAGLVPNTRQILPGTGISGGGPLSSDPTISLNLTYTDGRYGQTLTRGTGLTGSNYNGSAAQSWSVNFGTSAGTAAEGNDPRFSALGNRWISFPYLSDLNTFYSAGAFAFNGSTANTPLTFGSGFQFFGGSTTGDNGSWAWANQIIAGTNSDWYVRYGTGGSSAITWGSTYQVITSKQGNYVNWNTAYGWGPHAGLYSLLGHTHVAANITDFTTAARLTISATGVIAYNNSTGVISYSGTAGTVTSVGMSVPTGLSISGSPVTTTGTLALSYTAGYGIPTTAKQTQWDTAYGWGNPSGVYVPIGSGVTVTGSHNFTSLSLKLSGEYFHNLYSPFNTVYVNYYPSGGNGSTTTFARWRVWNGPGAALKELVIGGDGTFTWGGANVGTVTSVGISPPTGLTAGSAVTTSGNITLSYTAGYAIPTTTKQSQWDTAYGWGNPLGTFVRLGTADNITANHNFTGAIRLPGEYYHNLLPGYNQMYICYYPSGGNGGTSTAANMRVWNGPGGTYKQFYMDGDGNFTWDGYEIATRQNAINFTNKTGNISMWTNDSGYVTASSSNTFTNKSGNVSQWTNDSGYVTASSSHTFTNKGGNISQWTNDSNYVTPSGFATLTNKAGNISMWFNDAGYNSGSGSNGYLMKYTGANSTGNSTVYDNGSEVNFGSSRAFGVDGFAAFRNDLHAHGAVRFGSSGTHGTLIIHNLSSATIASSAAFEVRSTTKGSIPRPLMTYAERIAISSPAIGLEVYQTDATPGGAGAGPKIYLGLGWFSLTWGTA